MDAAVGKRLRKGISTENLCREALADLVEQLEGIGIPDWHGAEGLDLGQAKLALKRCADEDDAEREIRRKDDEKEGYGRNR